MTREGRILISRESTTDEQGGHKPPLEHALKSSPVAVAAQGLDLRYIWVHNPLAQFGRTADEFIGRTDDEVAAESDLPKHGVSELSQMKKRVLETGKGETRLIEFADIMGEDLYLEIIAEPLLDAEGDLAGVTSVVVDVTPYRQSSISLERRLASIVEHSADAIISLGFDGTVTSWNGGATKCFGFLREEIVGSSLRSILPDERTGETDEWLSRVKEGSSLTSQESRWVRKDGTQVFVSVTISPIYDDDGTIVGASIVARDITYRKEIEAKLQHLADHDALTGLFNRRRFGRELLREIVLARRFGGKGAVMVIDLDNFKAINDTLGHRSGDQVISRIGEVLKKSLRDVDIVARIGGDEFAVFMPDGNADEVAGRLGKTIRKTILGLGNSSHHTTASIGVAFVTDEQLNEDELLARADMAMYEAKAAGRDCFRIYSPEDLHRERAREGLNMSERVRGAVDAGAFEVYAQPILDLESGTVHQHELLIRMKDEAGGLIMPAAFLPTADRFGMIEEVDRWMVIQAIQLLSRLNGTEEGICLSVNLSARSIVDPDLFLLIEREIEAAGVCPENLALEVTETSVIENMDDARKLVTRMKNLGCKLALDDFGAGFGSFYYLKHLPFDYLKIDGDFIRGLPDSKTDQYMVEAIANLAGRLGKKTVAEYVEDQATLDLLEGYGIDYVQGFHIGRPRLADFSGPAEARQLVPN